MSWKSNQQVYETFVSDYLLHIAEACAFCTTEAQIIAYAKAHVYEHVEALPVKQLVAMHEYLMYMTDVRSDIRVPAYHYAGGDRITAVVRYLQKHMGLELAKQHA